MRLGSEADEARCAPRRQRGILLAMLGALALAAPGWSIEQLEPSAGRATIYLNDPGNHEDVLLFYEYMDAEAPLPSTFEDVPMRVLLPAYTLSELKTAFLMGFQIYLPFLIVDLGVASVTISMGMLMLPPQIVSLPFKLLLFVLVDGWRLVVQMLMNSFGTIT